MHRFKFTPDDVFVNRLKTYPEYNILIYQAEMFVNTISRTDGAGGLDVYDINRNREFGVTDIEPFFIGSSRKDTFKDQMFQPMIKNGSGDSYWKRAYVTPDVIPTMGVAYTGSYPAESTIQRRLTTPTTRTLTYWSNGNIRSITSTETINTTASALQNVARQYTTLSDHFIFGSSSVRSRDLIQSTINYLFIPSMYYGSSIKKGSVELDYYIDGAKIASCADINNNGTLIETTGTAVGDVVGIVMYNEGIMMLTASHSLDATQIEYVPASPSDGSWLYYGTTLNDTTASSATLSSASYGLNLKGTSYVNSTTMFAHAKKGELNHSNNPTYQNYESPLYVTGGATKLFEETSKGISNIVSASYISASFDKVTYISKVHIYDDEGNLIAISNLSKPLKKTLEDEFTFKIELDL